MPRFLVTRTLTPLTADELRAVAKNVVRATQEMDGMRWIRSHVTADGKHSFCEFEAPSADACVELSRRAGLPTDAIVPLGIDIGPVPVS
jgi:hypothetical protein